MGYIKFDKTQLINLEYSLKKEMIRSNRAGSFSCTTIIGCNTRKYHGLLVCPQPNLDGEQHVLLSKVDETVIQHDAEFNLGVNKYPGTYNPKGHKYVRDFSAEKVPTVTYRVGGVVLNKETMFVTQEERVLIKYTLLEANSPTLLRIKPFLAFRNIHRLSKRNIDLDTRYETVPNGIRVRMYSGYSNLFLQFSQKNPEYVHIPDWYCDFEYLEEKERGYDYHEDLYQPGYFELPIKKGESIIFSAGTRETNPGQLSRFYTNELKKRTPRNTFENCLLNSAQQFFYKHNSQTEIVAGYPWYDRIGRFTFISLPGISLAMHEKKACKEVIDTMKAGMRGPFFPESGRGSNTSFDAADTPLWFFWSLQHCNFIGSNREKIWREHGPAMQLILESYAAGTSNGIKMQSNGLIHIDPSAPHLTWMNSETNGKPITPRYGYVVEINALWYNAIKFAISLAKTSGDKTFADRWNAIAKRIEASFEEVFWNEDIRCLTDFVDKDLRFTGIRPNQILAASLPYSPLSENKRLRVIDMVKQQLLTPRGLRTLSPQDPSYKGHYGGDTALREHALHQGTVWPWLLGHFAEAYLRIFKEKGVPYVETLYNNFQEVMLEDGIGTISEIYEGNPPHYGCGAISFAASVGELLRMKHMMEQYRNSEKKSETKN
jgi:predicted glycogen debranching enzyme